ncbi:MAG: PrgI family protein [Candidatus Nomurabacteria bacterium]|nr:PrgI family protein [Candidatus Nomurabacteria bacterium]
MQFKVPQFLDIEDKIFGPFTFSEFVYLAGGAGLCFVIYRAWGLLIGIIPMLAVAGFSAALVFYRPNSKPFIDMLEAGFKYIFQYKLYIWKRSTTKKLRTTENNQSVVSMANSTNTGMQSNNQRLTGDKLRDLAWSLDVLDLKKEQN